MVAFYKLKVLPLNTYRVFIKYCGFFKILKYNPDSGLSRFPLGVSVCTQWQVKHQRYSRAGRVQKNHKILNKNTIFNEQPVEKSNRPEGRETTAFFTEGHQTVMGAGHTECFLFLMGQVQLWLHIPPRNDE